MDKKRIQEYKKTLFESPLSFIFCLKRKRKCVFNTMKKDYVKKCM